MTAVLYMVARPLAPARRCGFVAAVLHFRALVCSTCPYRLNQFFSFVDAEGLLGRPASLTIVNLVSGARFIVQPFLDVPILGHRQLASAASGRPGFRGQRTDHHRIGVSCGRTDARLHKIVGWSRCEASCLRCAEGLEVAEPHRPGNITVRELLEV